MGDIPHSHGGAQGCRGPILPRTFTDVLHQKESRHQNTTLSYGHCKGAFIFIFLFIFPIEVEEEKEEKEDKIKEEYPERQRKKIRTMYMHVHPLLVNSKFVFVNALNQILGFFVEKVSSIKLHSFIHSCTYQTHTDIQHSTTALEVFALRH